MAPDDLIERISSIEPVIWNGTAYRHTAPEFEPLSGRGAALIGGRWNPKGIPTIYLAMPEAACVAEFLRMAQGQARGPASFLPRDLHEISAREIRVIDLTHTSARRRAGITLADIRAADRTACQRAGAVANQLGVQGILAPSATREGIVIAAFEPHLRRGQLTVTSTRPLEVPGG